MIMRMDERYHFYLRDESKLTGNAESISFPTNEDEAVSVVRECIKTGCGVTVQGARTGISAGAVPLGGHIMNLSEMRYPLSMKLDSDGSILLRVQAGYTLSSLRRDLQNKSFEFLEDGEEHQKAWRAFKALPELFWPPDPSEATATLGGIAAMNASGPCSYRYGAAEKYIHAVRVILGDGEVYEITNEQSNFNQKFLTLPNGKTLEPDAACPRPSPILAGSEGMLGAIISLTLRLVPKPKEIWGICIFFTDEKYAGNFIDGVFGQKMQTLAALDFLDAKSLEMVRLLGETASKLRELPDVPDGSNAAVYIELHSDSEEAVEHDALRLMEWGEDNGADSDSSWAASGDVELERLRTFRHAVPESINAQIDRIRLNYPGAVKTATDMAAQGIPFSRLIKGFRDDINSSGLKAVVFGHAAGGNLHVNFLPYDEAQRVKAEALTEEWGRRCIAGGGQIAVEHGIGKLKKNLLYAAEAPEKIRAMKSLKDKLDPRGLWNPGNMFISAGLKEQGSGGVCE